MSTPRPPRAWGRLLAAVTRPDDRPYILADLAEEYDELVRREGDRAARRWYRRQAIRSLGPSLAVRLSRERRESPITDLPTVAPPGRDGMSMLARLWQDLLHAARSVTRSPRYSATVIVTFALASGANIAVFSVVNAVLLEPLPYPDPDRLAMTFRVTDHGDESRFSWLDFRDARESVESFDAWAAYQVTSRNWLGDAGAEEWAGVETSPELFDALGVPPALGRALDPDLDDMGAHVIVLSHALWERRFGADTDVIGRAVPFDGHTPTVVGVMPPGFYFPTPDEEFWLPLGSGAGDFHASMLENRGAWMLLTIGRLAEGVSLGAAQADVLAATHAVDEANAGEDDGETAVRVVSRHEEYVGDTRRLFGILLGAVGLVLAVACANIANIALTRAATRKRELAVRAALGAGRRRLGRQLIGEHILLALAGAGLGLLLSFVVVRGLVALGPAELPRLAEVGVDLTALAYAVATATLCGLLFGGAPAMMAARGGLAGAIKDDARGSLSRGARRALQGLVTAQVAIAVVLVLGASLLVNSFIRLSSVRPGFDTERVLVVGVSLAEDRYPDSGAIESFYRGAHDRLAGLAGVEAVGVSSHLPFSGRGISVSYALEQTGGERLEGEGLQFEVIGPGYFDAMGIPLHRGRDIRPDDRTGGPLVVVVNGAFADARWPGEDPVGKRLTLDTDEYDSWHTVVGVVGSTLKRGLDDDPRTPIAYFPRSQFHDTYGIISGRTGYLALRTSVPPAMLGAAVRSAIAEVDPTLPLSDIRTSAELVASSVAAPRFRTILVGSFAGLALLVALVGVYGVMAFAVARRTREIGIRMSLGASRRRVLAGVLRSGLGVVLVGLAIGIAGGLAASRVLDAMLFGLTPTDVASYGGAAVVVLGAGLLASYLPARRASRVEPVVALREE
ncbi:MAG: ADOP family duplicated permease [Gemmatimonadota bacterium]|nr:ADOP family duplicated permease [Gemmatimonadota bacterium]